MKLITTKGRRVLVIAPAPILRQHVRPTPARFDTVSEASPCRIQPEPFRLSSDLARSFSPWITMERSQLRSLYLYPPRVAAFRLLVNLPSKLTRNLA